MAGIAVLLTIFAFINVINGSVLIWSTEKIQIPALKQFTDKDFDSLLKQLNNPKVIAFNSPQIYDNVKHLISDDKYSAYIPNTDLNLENATDLTGVEDDDLGQIRLAVNDPDTNALIVMNQQNKRNKRSVDGSTTTTDASAFEPPSGPIVYQKDDIIIYSSKPPLLKTNLSTQYLGKTNIYSIDKRDAYAYKRFIVTIPLEDNSKIALRFKFPWSNGYWWLTSVEVEDTDGTTYNLTIRRSVTAPKYFSYHCAGITVFNDGKNSSELQLYDLQVQMDSKNGRFSDAYDCVPFTTGPIWSGLFVTFILALGLLIALNAIGSIKTMDKFDNQKTKQLSITVSE